MEKGAPFWLAIILAFIIMTLLGIATEKFVLRKLVNQPPITLFMATIGLAFFIEGLAPMVFRQRAAGPRSRHRRRADCLDSSTTGTWSFPSSTWFAAGCGGGAGGTLALFFQYTRIGRALRAVADDHQAALSIGIPLQHIWASSGGWPVSWRWWPA
jgi:branched-chain amino acid transport system permease protein